MINLFITIKQITADLTPPPPPPPPPPPGKYGRHFGTRYFQTHFLVLNENVTISTQISHASFASGNVLAPNRRQAITWSNADPVYPSIYAAPGGDEFKLLTETGIIFLVCSKFLTYGMCSITKIFIFSEGTTLKIKDPLAYHVSRRLGSTYGHVYMTLQYFEYNNESKRRLLFVFHSQR